MQDSEALAPWRHLVAQVEDGAAAQAELSESEPRRIPAILYPTTLREVRDIVDAARANGTPLYPVSTGMNWGLGSRHPVRDGCVLVDLRRLDRIRDLNLAHGYAVIEAGVSQHALAQQLDGTPWMLNVTTSCKDSSLLGNAMDRGEGCIRPRRDDLLGLELVLGDGSVLHTGGVGPGAARKFHGLGSGPDATGLFLQSSLGIATAGAFAFIPRPERVDYAFASFRRDGLAEVVDTVLKLRRERVLDTTFRLSELPVEPGRTGAPPDFTLLGPLLGRRAAVDATEAVLREELTRLPSYRSFECGPVADLPLTHPLYQRTQFFRGIPSCDMLRARFRVDDCDLDGRSESGWTVVATVLPLEGRSVQTALDVVTRVVDVQGLTCRLEVSAVSATTILLMTAIWFQRNADGIARMRRTQAALREQLRAAGLHPARDGVDAVRDEGPAGSALARIKAALDPAGIISPGRYV
jgi:4-cresol dehydrogenase (hydroxylating) flavoprotein subunit